MTAGLCGAPARTGEGPEWSTGRPCTRMVRTGTLSDALRTVVVGCGCCPFCL
jgi:hypothetical protein